MEHIDLHTHTLHTDGRHTVEYVLKEAEKTGISLFSISDHNSVEAYEHIPTHRHCFSGRILPAVELSTMYHGELIEVLGYGVDLPCIGKFIRENYHATLQDKQAQEAGLNVRVLREKGIKMSDEFFRSMTEDPYNHPNLFDLGPRPLILEEARRFPENAHFFESEEEFYTMSRHRWARYYLFNPKSELYIDQSAMFPSLRDVTEAIHQAGGLAFLAHTYIYSPTIAEALEDVALHYGLDGLECHYGIFTPEQKKTLCDFCDAHGLYKSGGSDFHGYAMRPDNIMGRSGGERIELSLVADWLDKVKDSLI